MLSETLVKLTESYKKFVGCTISKTQRKKISSYHHTDLSHDASARKHPLPIDTQ